MKATARRRRTVCVAAWLALALAPAAWAASPPFSVPSAGESLTPGSVVELRWRSVCDAGRNRAVDEAELVLSLDGGRTFPIRVTPELSPCATRFVWTVPSLPAAHARLAMRAGADENDATETVRIVSADFRILPDPDGRVERLRRHAAEWWTPSRPPVPTAEDLLERTMSPARPRMATPFAPSEASLVPEGPSGLRLERVVSVGSAVSHASPARYNGTASRPVSGSTPLRL